MGWTMVLMLLYFVLSDHTMYALLCCATLCHVTLCCATLCAVTRLAARRALCCAVSCCAALCHVVLCCVMLRCAVSCYAVLCHVTLCCATLCAVTGLAARRAQNVNAAGLILGGPHGENQQLLQVGASVSRCSGCCCCPC